ncbi:MAG: heavy metal translocating P-type ATPase, partial [Pseudomonadota bacterium]|nr:heavy metal translocating P-type ATPase [Pseudomonadota bacterium]
VTPPQPAGGGCYHCGLPVPPGIDIRVDILGDSRAMCCHGCQAVARAIVDGGLEDYYRFRTANPEPGREVVPGFLRETRIYDIPEIQEGFVTRVNGDEREATLILEGITCAACIWLNEQHLSHLPGVLEAHINYATHRARIRWDNGRISLGKILETIAAIGYRAHPWDPGRGRELLEADRKLALGRLGIAGALGMQVMMVAVALYVGDNRGMDADLMSFFHWVSFVLTIPIIGYSAQPFFRSAWRDLNNRRVGMDVPVSLGVLGAFGASVWATVSGQGHVYYESVAMFVFFLLTARYFELVGRRRSTEALDRLVKLTPAVATRIPDGDEGDLETIPVADLAPGNRVRILPGERVPADGLVMEGESSVDESLLTGESMPVARNQGSGLIGGSINIESPLVMRVEKVGSDTVLSHILRLLERAQGEKPEISRMADRAASWFVSGVLVLALATALYWWNVDPARWFEITVAVLVVTCPCALSLATPTAVTAATGALAEYGVLTTRANALDTLGQATDFVFDKTGTLTAGRPRLLGVTPLTALPAEEVLRIAAALERHSEHPLARCIVEADVQPPLRTTEITATPGGGITGVVDNERYYLGNRDYINRFPSGTEPVPPPETEGSGAATEVFLSTAHQWLATFSFGDRPRPETTSVVRDLHNGGGTIHLFSGDQTRVTHALARTVEIDSAHAFGELSPDRKLARVRDLQAHGAVVAMVGDGVNDAPVLAGADVSLAIGSGAQLAMTSADMVIMGKDLSVVVAAVRLARGTRRVIRQNLAWAITYNLLALPAAAAGLITPWMAALGMSASSLIVVANALRLTRRRAVTGN